MSHDPALPDLSARGPLWLGWLTLALLLGGFGSWSLLTQISGAIVASGRIEVEQNRQIVQHPDGGVIVAIEISEGDRVKAGDILLRLDGTLIASELAVAVGQLNEARARRARLEAERDGLRRLSISAALAKEAERNPQAAEQLEGQRRLFTARVETMARTRAQLDKRKIQIQAQIAGINAQTKALSNQLRLIETELSDQQSLLAKGLAQAPRVLSLQREEARLAGEWAQAEGRITELDLEALRLAAERREEASSQLRDITTSELQLVQKVTALSEQMARLDIRAPVSGTVLGLQVTTPRAVLRPADPVAYIIPQDRPLIITAQVSPLHIDEVQLGQKVKLILPAFSSASTPELNGVVALVSADALSDQSQNIYYRIEITLHADEASRLGQALFPGMPVEAFIQTGARSPMVYLLQPFSDYFSYAFRES